MLALAAVTGLVWVTATPLIRVVRAEPEAASRTDTLPAEALAELADGLPDPVLMISGQDRDDYAGRRILFRQQGPPASCCACRPNRPCWWPPCATPRCWR